MTKPISNNHQSLVADLVETARKLLNHDAGDDEPQDVWEIDLLTREFTKIVERYR